MPLVSASSALLARLPCWLPPSFLRSPSTGCVRLLLLCRCLSASVSLRFSHSCCVRAGLSPFLTRLQQVTAATLEHHAVSIEESVHHNSAAMPEAHAAGAPDSHLAAALPIPQLRRSSLKPVKPEVGECSLPPAHLMPTRHASPLSRPNRLPSRLH